ncbi:hypothetical protein FOXG_06960 [Fusarium oxysporum f. sp. lycopersici 4287]|uniref:Epoxide hydrolase N-terminal domain-containing protein n=1 Tax=Fusarium oxysporum f. sp. lycopersici (strain 4287 / CBS 123668 / FGSC 9935 / NRRL 34936) TaxID=426428 RepID=A0A0J9V4E9_FUSO4|nr:hypothetical protein FOXG_06960 [Fusarium oxysporum f. sp. lycopersici 4287]KAJ9419790.1 Alpha/Beta hydrolase protein [Fusarium oxysporum]KNB06145.1 hypothetical protein FOXG_06960 [Fusarium oxysporum f. sp. lycopersici 4287]
MTVSTPLPFSFPEGITSPQPFEISVNSDFIRQTQAKVETWRPPTGLWSNWTNEGPPLEQLKDIAQYWRNEYDWLSVQTRMNQEANHYATTVKSEGNYNGTVSLHFVHQRSSDPNAIPLLLLHGWPSTHLEWSKVIKPLVNHANTPFHVVAPDLPGFGFSPAPTQPVHDPHENGKIMDSLMKQLGYSKYGIFSTDLGWQIAMCMVVDVQPSVIGHMTDFFPVIPNNDDLARKARNETTEEENSYLKALNEWFTSHSAYSEAHTQKPLALSLAFTDSPVGFLGWMWDLMHTVSDGYKCSYEELITDAMMLYIPGPYRNIRLYLESFKMSFPKSIVPTGISEWGNGKGSFPELASFQLTPRSWTERSANVVYFARHPSGGHFPAISHPEEWVQDVRNFFSGLIRN